MQNQEEIKQKVCTAIEEALNLPNPISDTSVRFEEDLKADSIDMVSMLIVLEEELKVDIDDEKSYQLETVDDVIQYVVKLKQGE